jgi:ligand-binding sensor domain-containing protein/two-component sensor histidine kinase
LLTQGRLEFDERQGGHMRLAKWDTANRSPCSLLLVAALLILTAIAQAERLPTRLYTTTDGLWSGVITHLMRDSRGFLWFCTRDGLSRFDGYRFVNYKIGNGSSSQYFSYMYETHRGIYWIVADRGGLYRYDPNSTISSTEPPQADPTGDDGRVVLHAELESQQVFRALQEDRDGNLWAGGEGLFLVEEKNGHVSFRQVELNLPQEMKQSFLVYAIAAGPDGSLWLGTSRGLLRRLPDGRVAQYALGQKPASDPLRTLLADRDGNIWVLHSAGLYLLKPELLSALTPWGRFTRRRLNPHPPGRPYVLPRTPGEAVDLTSVFPFHGAGRQIFAIYQQSNGQIWAAINDRLLLFDGQHFRDTSELKNALQLMVEDSDGDLWFATPNGVMRFSLQGFRSYDRADGLRDPEIDSIYEDHGGGLHVINGVWFVSRLDGRTFRTVRPNIPADAASMWTATPVFMDHTGQWWLLTSRGLYRFTGIRRAEDLTRAFPSAIYTDLDGLPAQHAYCMFEDSRGDLWISIRWTDGGVHGLVRWQRSTGAFHRFREADGLPPLKSASSFAEDKAGNLWFGFYEGGLVRYAKGRFTHFTPANGLPEGFISALHAGRSGGLWLTSNGGGLSRIDDPTAERPRFINYTTREGLSSDNARCITEDLAGDIYIGTVRGIDRLTPETGKVRHYGVGDGLAGDFVVSARRDHKGFLWFGTFNGLSRFDPHAEHAAVAPSIRIDGLRIAGVRQPLSELGSAAIGGVELSAGQRNLQIDFSSLSIAHAASLHYQYQLQGIDRDWGLPTDQRTVNYATLSPGAYSFLVRTIDSSGVTSPQPARVSFRILPPIWQRWWFLALAAMAIAYMVRSVYLYRVAHLIELERIRTRIATDLHDDIGSSLSQIAVLSEVARRQVDGNAAASRPLATIALTSRELVGSMSDIVWATNPSKDRFSDLSQRMRRFAGDLFAAHDIDFRFTIHEPDHPVKLEANVRRQVFLIFKESVNNMVRHSACAAAEVELGIERHWITLTLADNGRGFDTAQASDGHGLLSMQQRATSLGAVLEITSQANLGTTILLKVPLARTPGFELGKDTRMNRWVKNQRSGL